MSNRGLPAPSPHMADGTEQEAVLCWFVSFKEIIPEEEGGLCYREISSPIEADLWCFFSSHFTRQHPDGWHKEGCPACGSRMGALRCCLESWLHPTISERGSRSSAWCTTRLHSVLGNNVFSQLWEQTLLVGCLRSCEQALIPCVCQPPFLSSPQASCFARWGPTFTHCS